MSKPARSVPDALPVREALGRSDVLRDLQHRLAQSQERLQVARSLLPPELARELRSGVLDDKGWNLLVPSSAAAAKLRHWLPRIETALKQRGLEVSSIRVRVQSDTSPNV